MSRRLNEIKTSLNSQIQDAITSGINSTVLSSIQNTLEMQGRANFTMVDRGSAVLHPGPRAANSTMDDQKENRPKKCFMQENNRQIYRQSSVDSYNSVQNCDMVTGANPNPRMVPEFLTGRPMQSCEPLQRQNSNNDESQDQAPTVQETTSPTTPTDPINCLLQKY